MELYHRAQKYLKFSLDDYIYWCIQNNYAKILDTFFKASFITFSADDLYIEWSVISESFIDCFNILIKYVQDSDQNHYFYVHHALFYHNYQVYKRYANKSNSGKRSNWRMFFNTLIQSPKINKNSYSIFLNLLVLHGTVFELEVKNYFVKDYPGRMCQILDSFLDFDPNLNFTDIYLQKITNYRKLLRKSFCMDLLLLFETKLPQDFIVNVILPFIGHGWHVIIY